MAGHLPGVGLSRSLADGDHISDLAAVTHDSAPALHTCLPIYHAYVLLMVNDTRFIALNADYTCLHSWAGTGREAPAHNDTDYS